MKSEVNFIKNYKWFLLIIVVLLVLIFIWVYFGDEKKDYYFLQDNQCIKVKEFPEKITFSHYEKLKDCEDLIIRQCDNDNDCIKIQTSCCSCNMGGEEKCVLYSEVEKYNKMLDDCSDKILCPAVFMCEIENCKCVNGGCVG